MNWIYPLYICEYLLFFVAYFLSKKDIMSPSVVMCIMFLLSTTIAILAADQVQIVFGMESFGILVAGISTFILAETIFQHWFQRNVTRKVEMQRIFETQNESFCVSNPHGLVIIIAIIIEIPILIWYLREMLRIAGGFGGAVRSIIVNTVVTSWNDAIVNPLLTPLLKITKALSYISGFILIQRLLAKEKGALYITGLLSLMSFEVIVAMVTGSRGEMLEFISALLIEYSILWHQKNGWHRNLSWKLIRIGIIVIAVGIPLFYYSALWMGRTKLGIMRPMTEIVNIYLGYPIYNFDLYVKQPSIPYRHSFGEESLIGVNTFLSKYLGINTYVRNVNLEYHYSNGYFLGNVYTFFRRPLHDFGFVGMLIFTVLVAFLFSWIYYGKIKWRRRTITTDCWSLTYGYIFYWIVSSSIDQYSHAYVSLNNIVVVLLMFIIYHLLNNVVVTPFQVKYVNRKELVDIHTRI